MLTIYTEALAKNACETYSDYEYIYTHIERNNITISKLLCLHKNFNTNLYSNCAPRSGVGRGDNK